VNPRGTQEGVWKGWKMKIQSREVVDDNDDGDG
jgi:hypothetical protein